MPLNGKAAGALVGRAVVIVLLLLRVAMADAGEVVRCLLADGRVEYRDRDCPASARESDRRPVAAAPLRHDIGRWRCQSDPAERAVLAIDPVDATFMASLPEAQRSALRSGLNGLALGRCGLHGQGCSGTLALYREREGVVFLCAGSGSEPGWVTELRVLADGRMAIRRGDSEVIRMLDPSKPAADADSFFRVDLDGHRLPLSHSELRNLSE